MMRRALPLFAAVLLTACTQLANFQAALIGPTVAPEQATWTPDAQPQRAALTSGATLATAPESFAGISGREWTPPGDSPASAFDRYCRTVRLVEEGYSTKPPSAYTSRGTLDLNWFNAVGLGSTISARVDLAAIKRVKVNGQVALFNDYEDQLDQGIADVTDPATLRAMVAAFAKALDECKASGYSGAIWDNFSFDLRAALGGRTPDGYSATRWSLAMQSLAASLYAECTKRGMLMALNPGRSSYATEGITGQEALLALPDAVIVDCEHLITWAGTGGAAGIDFIRRELPNPVIFGEIRLTEDQFNSAAAQDAVSAIATVAGYGRPAKFYLYLSHDPDRPTEADYPVLDALAARIRRLGNVLSYSAPDSTTRVLRCSQGSVTVRLSRSPVSGAWNLN